MTDRPALLALARAVAQAPRADRPHRMLVLADWLEETRLGDMIRAANRWRDAADAWRRLIDLRYPAQVMASIGDVAMVRDEFWASGRDCPTPKQGWGARTVQVLGGGYWRRPDERGYARYPWVPSSFVAPGGYVPPYGLVACRATRLWVAFVW